MMIELVNSQVSLRSSTGHMSNVLYWLTCSTTTFYLDSSLAYSLLDGMPL